MCVYEKQRDKKKKKGFSLAKSVCSKQIEFEEKEKGEGNVTAISLGMRESRLVSNVVPATTVFFIFQSPTQVWSNSKISKEKGIKKKKKASRDFPCPPPSFYPGESRKIEDKKHNKKNTDDENKSKVERRVVLGFVYHFPNSHRSFLYHMIFAMLSLSLPAGLAVGLDGSLPYFGTSEVYRGASDSRCIAGIAGILGAGDSLFT